MATFVRAYCSEKNHSGYTELPAGKYSQVVTAEWTQDGKEYRTHMFMFASNANTKRIENYQETELKIDGEWKIQVISNEDRRFEKLAVATVDKYVNLVDYQATGVPVVVGPDVALVQAEVDAEGNVTNAELIGTVKPGYVTELEFYCMGVMPQLFNFFLFSIARMCSFTLPQGN